MVERAAFLRDYLPVAGPQTPIARLWTARDVADRLGDLSALSQDQETTEWVTAMSAVVTENERRLAHMAQVLDPLGDGLASVSLIDVAGNDRAIVQAARVSYANDRTPFDPVRDAKLLRFLMEHNHGTPLEHTFVKYHIKAPLYVLQEVLRHRIGVSINQQSMRYLQPSEKWDVEFYVPPEFRAQDTKNKQGSVRSDALPKAEMQHVYTQSVTAAKRHYEDLLALGCARELARGVLPHSTYSSLYLSANLRSLMHFLGLRLAPNAQREIQCYAQAMMALAEPFFPVTFAMWREMGCDPMLTEELRRSWETEVAA
jgi:thymidylate synthase (FAD)